MGWVRVGKNCIRGGIIVDNSYFLPRGNANLVWNKAVRFNRNLEGCSRGASDGFIISN